MKRITISMDDELHAVARAHAVASRMSLSKAINDLLRRQVAPPPGTTHRVGTSRVSPVTGLRVSRGDRPVTDEDVRRAADDEDEAAIERTGAGATRIDGLRP